MDYQFYKSMENTVLKSSESENSYVLKQLLANGAQGAVYQALNKKNSEQVALKLQPEIQPNEQRVLKKFINHSQEMHYNVKIYEMFKYQSHVCVIMEFANGGNLLDYIQRNQDLTMTNKIEIVKQISLGVQELHNLQLVHRDIKPENIVFSIHDNGDKIFKICDTGLIKIQADDFIDPMGVGTGTPAFQAPEMIESMDYNEKVDIWALGCVYYEIFTSQPLFQGDVTEEIYSQIQQYARDPRQITNVILSLSLPSDIAQLLIFMIHPNPQERPFIKDIVKFFQPRIKILPKQPITRRVQIKIIMKPQVEASNDAANLKGQKDETILTQLPEILEQKYESNVPQQVQTIDQNDFQTPQKILTLQHFTDLQARLINDNQSLLKQLEIEKQDLSQQVDQKNQIIEQLKIDRINLQTELQLTQENTIECNRQNQQLIKQQENNQIQLVQEIKNLEDKQTQLETRIKDQEEQIQILTLEKDKILEQYLNQKNTQDKTIMENQQHKSILNDSEEEVKKVTSEQDKVIYVINEPQQQIESLRYQKIEQRQIDEGRSDGGKNIQTEHPYSNIQEVQESQIIQHVGQVSQIQIPIQVSSIQQFPRNETQSFLQQAAVFSILFGVQAVILLNLIEVPDQHVLWEYLWSKPKL